MWCVARRRAWHAGRLLFALSIGLSACTPAEQPTPGCAVEIQAQAGSPFFQEAGFAIYPLPWEDGFVHDAVVDPAGLVWFTDMWNDCLGRLDPASGRMEAIPLPTAGASPHGAAAGAEGTVWYAASGAGRLGRLEAATRAIEEFPLSREPIDPHTVLVHGNAIWFTAPGGRRYGRLDPTTGQTRLYETPLPAPYDMALSPDGSIWITLGRTHHLGRVDAASGELALHPLPDLDARPSGVAVNADGTVWYVDAARGLIGSLDPETSAVREFAASGERSYPRALSVGPDGRLWYFEEASGRLVAFDPATGEAGWLELPELPLPGAVVRRLSADETRNGLWMGLGEAAAVAFVEAEAIPGAGRAR